MFFRKRKKYLTEKSTQAASDTDRFADVIFGLCFEGIKPNDNMRITAAATNVATIFDTVDNSQYGEEWTLEERLFATALIYMHPLIRRKQQLICAIYNAVHYAVDEEFDPLICGRRTHHFTVSERTDRELERKEQQAIFEKKCRLETEGLTKRVAQSEISDKEFIDIATQQFNKSYKDGVNSSVLYFRSLYLTSLAMNLIALINWANTKLSEQEVEEYVYVERHNICATVKETTRTLIESPTEHSVINEYVYQSLNNADFRDIVSNYENMTLCE